MSIGIVTNTYDVKRGTGIARYTQELVKGLVSEGFSVKVVCSEPPKIPMGKPINHLLKLPVKTLRSIRDCDLIHAMTPVAAFSFPFINKPKIVTHHELSFLFPGRGKARYVTLFAPLWYRLGAICDAIIVPSSLTKIDLINFLGVPEEKVFVVNLGVDEKFKPLGKESKRDYFVIGYLGMLGYKKRVDYLLRSFWYLKRKNPKLNIKLHIYGKKELEFSHLVRLAEELGLANDVEFKGFVPNKAYNSMDVFVFPSDWEGFGLPILEAQRCGVPVVVRSDAHLPVEVTKYCIKANSEEDMADKIFQLITINNLRKKVSKNGIKYSKRFTWHKTVSETIKVYEKILDSR